MTLGPVIGADGTRFSVWSPDAAQLWLCLFDDADREVRLPMLRDADGCWHGEAAGVGEGARYGFRPSADSSAPLDDVSVAPSSFSVSASISC